MYVLCVMKEKLKKYTKITLALCKTLCESIPVSADTEKEC
jgi:hypothetical protein